MNIFKKPYPKGGGANRTLSFAFGFGVFVFVFLLVFQPFGLNEWETQFKVLKLAGYGLVTSMVILVNGFILERFFKKWYAEQHWTVGKEIISGVWNILFIGSLNLLYTRLLGVARIDLMSFIAFQWITLIVGVIPVTVVTLLNYSRLDKLNTKGAYELNAIINSEPLTPTAQPLMKVELLAENDKDKLVIDPDKLLAIAAADNYVEVYFQTGDVVEKRLLRLTLKRVEELVLVFPQFMRCHRSFIVNLNHVEKVSGNSQGLKLHLNNTELRIPVSRSLNEIIKQRLQERHAVRPS